MPVDAALGGLLLPILRKNAIQKQAAKINAQDAYRQIKAKAAATHTEMKQPFRNTNAIHTGVQNALHTAAPAGPRRTRAGGQQTPMMNGAIAHFQSKPTSSSIGPTQAVDSFNAAAVWPTTGHRTSTYTDHDGVDINGPGQDYGNPIYAFKDGKITYSGEGRGYGNAIFEQIKGGPQVVYGHGSEVYVKPGQRVKAGDLIGRVGSTGHSTGPHLHFGIPGGTYEQAMALLQEAARRR